MISAKKNIILLKSNLIRFYPKSEIFYLKLNLRSNNPLIHSEDDKIIAI